MRPEEVINKATERAREMKDNTAEAAKSAYQQAGETLSNAASTVRENVGTVATAVSDGAHYIAEQGLGDLNAEVSALVRKHPLQALALGVGLGVLIGNAMSMRR